MGVGGEDRTQGRAVGRFPAAPGVNAFEKGPADGLGEKAHQRACWISLGPRRVGSCVVEGTGAMGEDKVLSLPYHLHFSPCQTLFCPQLQGPAAPPLGRAGQCCLREALVAAALPFRLL